MWILLFVLVGLVAGAVLYNGLVSGRESRRTPPGPTSTFNSSGATISCRTFSKPYKRYARHEEGMLQRVLQARSAAMSTDGLQEHAQAENMLTSTLKSLFALSEAYPDLQADRNFGQLQETLAALED